ncbi:hypothetical protein [Lentilactobacillus sp. SPB1-3]|uniref:Uncharacterized protein n=1 Tax=Lentilactobacillus terminaliae TaxID=3003483 RepID=A0ACD5DDJ4_9LACO|nr:hypothetical protein [Lentilactobacillus sp. SPB1-3]MCZ0978040.1 hypothetical protein [Lentilactobacillus sp. SPB1-3]
MDAKAKRIFIREINQIFRMFSVSFQYALPTKSIQDDEWGDDSQSEQPEWQDVYEPLIAVGNSAQANIANQVVQLPGGQTDTYAYEWLSKLDLPTTTKVMYHEQELEIIKIGPYQDQTGIFIYFLRGRGDKHVQK